MASLSNFIFDTIIAAVIVIIILILYQVIMFIVRRSAKNQRIPLEAINGIKIIVRIITVSLIVIALLTFIPGSSSFLLSISSITGIIIGFASTQVVSQFIAGIYLLSSRPFKVNDLISINGIDGLVLEIGLNFTTLQKFSGTIIRIPNKKILDAEVLKYTVKLTPEIFYKKQFPYSAESQISEQDDKLEEPKQRSKKRKSRKLKLKEIKEIFMDSEVIRYTFEIAVDLDRLPEKVIDAVNQVCDLHKKIYQYRPEFILNYIYWRVHIRFKIYCNNPYVIIKNHSHFIKDVLIAIYGGG
jgi:small-conductance mechanosensitive channel